MIKFCFYLFFLIVNQIYSQSKFKIRLVNSPNKSIKDVFVANFEGIAPLYADDSTLLFNYNIQIPEYLFIVINKASMWYTRAWINPLDDVELLIDLTNHSTKLIKPKEWDIFTEKWGILIDNHQNEKSDSLAKIYILKNRNSYLSLWLLGHGAGSRNRDLRANLFNELDNSLKIYSEYKDIQHDLIDRRIPKNGEAFKEFVLEDIYGNSFDSRKFENKIVLLHFWSNSCGPCVKGMDSLVAFYGRLD